MLRVVRERLAQQYERNGLSEAHRHRILKRIDPDDPNVLGNLANLHLERGESARAQALYRKVLAIDPNDQVLFGLVIGYADEEAPANACRTTREPAARNVRFVST